MPIVPRPMADTSRPCVPSVLRRIATPILFPNRTVWFGYSSTVDHEVTTDEERPSADPSAPRERVLAAAFIEFAVHGIAGARIDRIAKAAKTSKERVYVSFR